MSSNISLKMKQLLAFLAILWTFSFVIAQPYPFQNTTLSDEERLDDLISRMTLEEKLDNLSSRPKGAYERGRKSPFPST